MRIALLILLTACQAPRVRFFGRAGGPKMAWSASGFEMRCDGTRLGFELRDVLPKRLDPEGRAWPNRFRVMLDDLSEDLVLRAPVTWVRDVPKGVHRLRVFKQTEALVGEAELVRLVCDGKYVEPEPPPDRRLAFIGDSMSAGYGNEGTDKRCHFSEATENQWLAFPSLTARALSAEAHVTAWSGKGVVRNYFDPDRARAGVEDALEKLTVPQIWERTLPLREDSRWDFSKWQAHAVVIALGYNDVAGGDPGPAFVRGYRAFVRRVRDVYPSAQILCVVPPMTDAWPANVKAWSVMRRYVSEAVRGEPNVHVMALPPEDPEDGLGCDWHPTLARHRKMAAAVTEALRGVTGWR